MGFKTLLALPVLTAVSLSCFSGNFYNGKVIEEHYSVTLPFEIENNAIFVTIPLEGTNYKFLLDTAAPNIINSKVIKNLNLKKVKNTIELVDSNGVNQDLNMYNLPDIKMGNTTFNGFVAIFAEDLDKYPFSCYEAVGIIGYNMLKYSVVTFNFNKHTLTISDSPPKDLSKNGYLSVGFFFNFRDGPFINLHHEFGNVPIALDTGFNGGILIEDEYIQPNLDEMGYVGKDIKGGITSYGINGKENDNSIKFYELDNLEFGRLKVDSYPVRTSLIGNKSLMGISFLKQYNVVVDYKGGVAWFKPGQKIIEINKFKIPSPLTGKYRCNVLDSPQEISSMIIQGSDSKVIKLN